MKRIMTAAMILLLLGSLSACSACGGSSGTETDTQDTAILLPPYTGGDTDGETLPSTDQPGTSAESDATTAGATEGEVPTEPTTEPTTEPMTAPATEPVTEPDTILPETVEIVIPTEDPADLTPILRGEDSRYDLAYNFVGADLAALRSDGALRFSMSAEIQSGEQGLTVPANRSAAVGFTRPMSNAYTVYADLSATLPEGSATPDAYAAVMLGLRCADAGHLYSDSGLWIFLQGDSVFVCLGGVVSPLPLLNGAVCDTQAGVALRAEDDGNVLRAYINERLLLTAKITDSRVTVYNSSGAVVTEGGLDKLASGDKLGYVRVMSRGVDSCFSSLRAVSKGNITTYAPHTGTVALKAGRDYLFRDKTQYMTSCSIVAQERHFFVDAQTLAELFDFDCRISDGAVILSRDRLTLTFRGGEASVEANGESLPFPTVLQSGEALLISADWLADMLGYVVLPGAETLYIFPNATGDAQVLMAEMDARYSLYERAVYPTDAPQFDPTGVGLYEATAPSDRLVGIAYTAGHTAGRSWGSDHLPLYGAYVSNDRETIYRHGLLLAAAGVDFVYVDWSRNTLFDAATGDPASEYYMIEAATDLLFEVWSTIPNAPRICILIGPGSTGNFGIAGGNQQKKADQVYAKYATAYPELYFSYEGKPLLLCYAGSPTLLGESPSWNDSRFTLRWMTDFVGDQGSLFQEDELSAPFYWGRRGNDDQVFTVRDGAVEAVTCAGAWSGRDFGEGEALREQFARAEALGARIALLTGWNEWSESSADLEPSAEDGHFRYDLLCELIRHFKD